MKLCDILPYFTFVKKKKKKTLTHTHTHKLNLSFHIHQSDREENNTLVQQIHPR